MTDKKKKQSDPSSLFGGKRNWGNSVGKYTVLFFFKHCSSFFDVEKSKPISQELQVIITSTFPHIIAFLSLVSNVLGLIFNDPEEGGTPQKDKMGREWG